MSQSGTLDSKSGLKSGLVFVILVYGMLGVGLCRTALASSSSLVGNVDLSQAS